MYHLKKNIMFLKNIYFVYYCKKNYLLNTRKHILFTICWLKLKRKKFLVDKWRKRNTLFMYIFLYIIYIIERKQILTVWFFDCLILVWPTGLENAEKTQCSNGWWTFAGLRRWSVWTSCRESQSYRVWRNLPSTPHILKVDRKSVV